MDGRCGKDAERFIVPRESIRLASRRGLRSWATANGSVRQLWLFGSRAREDAREDSDVDLALALMPADGKHNWALGNYYALECEWKRELEAIVGRAISIEPLVPGQESDARVRREGVLLWARG
jgi:predicted nucleotidyltransferase